METSLQDIPIGSLLLQQPPFRFVSGLVSFTEEDTVVRFRVGNCLLLEEGVLTPGGLMEHMAQACAVRAGYYYTYILHQGAKTGLLGQVKKCQINRLPREDEELITTVHLLQDVFGISLCQVTVTCEGETIAAATIKSADNPHA